MKRLNKFWAINIVIGFVMLCLWNYCDLIGKIGYLWMMTSIMMTIYKIK
jgi:hypothetical protein